MARLRDGIAFAAGKLALAAMRLIGKRGYHIPGLIAYRISPQVLDYIRKPDAVVFVTGTNGKSTTTALVRHVLEASGKKVAYNTESNTQPGILSALLRYTSAANRPLADVLVLEAAEEALEKVIGICRPSHLLLTNIQKDTFQVNLSPNYVLDKIRSLIADDMTLFVNNDDPAVLSCEREAARAVTYGVREAAAAAPPDVAESDADAAYAVTEPCPVCHRRLVFDYQHLPCVGRFRCPACGFASHDRPDYAADGFDLDAGTIRIGGQSFPMHYRATHFVYNYLLAYAFAKEQGVPDGTIARAFDTFVNIEGRMEEEELHGMRIFYSRFKQETPVTLQCSIDQICRDPAPKTVVVSLNLVDNGTWGPVFTETFYAYDCDFTRLADAGVERFLCASRTVAYDAANRLAYAGVPKEKIAIVDSDDPRDLFAALDETKPARVYILAYLGHYKKIRKAIEHERQG